MHITVILVILYILNSIRVGVGPWKFFRVNSRYFSREKGIFSKLEIDQLIPERWRLMQCIDGEHIEPDAYPVFLKPEWGQNGNGIVRADSAKQLAEIRSEYAIENRRYMIQEAATGSREFEIFGIKSGREGKHHDLVTVTESVNDSSDYPINSVNNKQTVYLERTDRFTAEQLSTLSGFIQEIGEFAITRMCARADSEEALLAGDFQIIEVNLFIPFPINLVDPRYTWGKRLRFINHAMYLLAHATRNMKPDRNPPAILTRMIFYGRTRGIMQRPSGRPIGTRRTHP